MKFSKALRHIDIADVKKKHHEKIVARKIKEEIEREEQEYISSVMKQVKYNWRSKVDVGKTIRESMTTSDIATISSPPYAPDPSFDFNAHSPIPILNVELAPDASPASVPAYKLF